MPTYLLLGLSLINALIIITLLFEVACDQSLFHQPASAINCRNTTLAEHDCEVLPWKT